MRENFLTVFHDNVCEIGAIDRKSTGLKNLHEIRMGEFFRFFPLSLARLCIHGVGADEFDDRSLDAHANREKDTTIGVASQPLQERELPVDCTSLQLLKDRSSFHGNRYF